MNVNKSRAAALLAAAVIGGMVSASTAHAVPITYTYTLQSTTSVPTGLTGNGTFTLSQDPLTVAGFKADSTNVASLITAFDFTIDGQTFDVFNVPTSKPDPNGNVTNLEFNSNGTLYNITFQGDNNVTGGIATLFLNGSQFSYGTQADTDSARGNLVLTTNPPARVPEPITVSLFGAGLAAVAATRRRKKTKKAYLA